MIRLTNEAIEFRLRDEEMIEFGGDLTWHEREEMRARIRQHIEEVIAGGNVEFAEYVIRWIGWPSRL